MLSQLKISVGQFSDKGRKEINQDFHGAYIPEEPQLTSKGIAIALADGISSSDVGQEASEATVSGFLEDYFCTSEAWTVKKSVQQVLTAMNSWLYTQTQQGQHHVDENKGMVCTLSAMVVKSTTAHLFHVGDTRIYRLRDGELEQLTNDHRVWVSKDKNFLSRAMGVNYRLDIDYKTIHVDKGDLFLLVTDGIYEDVDAKDMAELIYQNQADLDLAAKQIVELAYENGSEDNLTAQVVRIDDVPSQNADDVFQQLTELPFPPELDPGMSIDGFRIEKVLHASNRTQVYLALDTGTGTQVIMKTPSVNFQDDPAYLERFLMEEWIARRINNKHVLKPIENTRRRNFMYYVTEYIEGKTLGQWIEENPKPELDVVRKIVEQIAKGLRAFHRLEMLHQDLKPDNVMLSKDGTVKIIDFGSTKVAGVMEISTPLERDNLLGTVHYTAPEYLLGESGSSRSDLFSLGVITYEMLAGTLPYADRVAKATTKAAQKKLLYLPLKHDERDIPVWVDGALKKAVAPDPLQRYEELTEFLFDLHHANKNLVEESKPLLERDPLLFWKGLAFFQSLIIIFLLINTFL